MVRVGTVGGRAGVTKTYERRTVRLPRFLCEQVGAYLADRPHAPDDLVFFDAPGRAELGAVAATGTPSFSPAVPPACHKQRARAVASGQSRSLRKAVAAVFPTGQPGWQRPEVRIANSVGPGGWLCLPTSWAREAVRGWLKPKRDSGRLHGLADDR